MVDGVVFEGEIGYLPCNSKLSETNGCPIVKRCSKRWKQPLVKIKRILMLEKDTDEL